MKDLFTLTLRSNLRSASHIVMSVGQVVDNGTIQCENVREHLSMVADKMDELANEIESLPVHTTLIKLATFQMMLELDVDWEDSGFDAQQVNGIKSLLIVAKNLLN